MGREDAQDQFKGFERRYLPSQNIRIYREVSKKLSKLFKAYAYFYIIPLTFETEFH